MKTTKNICAILFIFTSISINAQLKVLTNGCTEISNQTIIRSDISHVSDGLDVTYSNPSIPNNYDLIWGYNNQPQPNNPGLLTLQSVDGAYFTVRANGRAGIYNNNPSCALEVGTVGTNYEIKVNGSIVLSSDERVKINIKSIDKSLEKLKLLKSVSYNFKGVNENVAKAENSLLKNTNINYKPTFKPQNNKDSYGRNYYGFLAQDVQKLFPDLVYKDSTGMLSVDYLGMIPLLLNALNEQEITISTQIGKIADLETRLSKLENSNNSSPKKVSVNIAPAETDTLTYPVLEQNIPNPFNIATTIGFYLPNSVSIANIYVYDMNGVQLKSYSVAESGKEKITIQGSEFNAGMYIYALIADGKVIDTKRMILTK
ncbi:MAG: tail fiber domain-containing protein [Bacteroidota bacterium]|nr:tail fiber domain-containing protein [Bacteroidota bacterium]